MEKIKQLNLLIGSLHIENTVSNILNEIEKIVEIDKIEDEMRKDGILEISVFTQHFIKHQQTIITFYMVGNNLNNIYINHGS